MKRITSLKTVAVLVMLLSCLTLQAVNAITYTATYSPDKLTTGTDTLGGVTYSTVAYEGLFNGGAPGTPSLPVDYLKFSVPWNATNFTVTANLSNSTLVSLGYMVYPNQQPRLMSDTTGWSITLPDSIAYLPNVYHPSNSNSAWVVDEGFLAGENHIVTVAVMPVAYYHRRTTNADRKMIKLSQSIDITLSYDLSDSLAMYPIIRQNTALRSEGYRLTQSLVVNPTNVVNSAPTSMTPDTLIVINPGSGVGGGLRYEIDSTAVYCDTLHITPGVEQMAQYQYLIVTTPEFKHSVRRLAALKRQKGYTVKVVTMDEVSSHPYARYGDLIKQTDGTYLAVDTTSTGKLRQFLKMYYNNYGTEYVLLVGNGVPYRTWLNIPTDWYYSDLNADYNVDQSDYTANFNVDYYADLYVGRLLAKTPEQIDNYTDKVLMYEMNPGNGDYSFLRRAIATEGIFESSYFYHTMLSNLSNFIPDVSLIKEQQGQNYPTGKNIIDSINNNKYGFICSLNHGSPHCITVYGHAYPDTITRHRIWAIDSVKNLPDSETGNGLNNLHNKYFPMIYYSLCCETMPFGNNGITNLGESFTTGKDYGGPIYIGYTVESMEIYGYELMNTLLNNLSGVKYKIGAAYSISKKGYRGLLGENPKYAIAQNLLGDPTIELWTDIPELYSDVTVTRYDNSITLSGIDADSTITIVAIKSLSQAEPKTILNSDSTLSINQISPNSTIMLYKHNHIPYILPLVLQNVELDQSQYVFASDVVAGSSVDSVRTPGNVSVSSGTEFEIEATGTVTLQGGFEVEKGATFAVYPSSFR